MTELSMHAISAPVFARMLNNLSALLAKGEAHAKAKGFDPHLLLSSRLAPDMFTLLRQVQIATDHAKGTMARLAGDAPQAIEDNEITIADVQARIARVLDIVQSYSADQLKDSATREITIKIPNAELKFTGLDYVNFWALPNFYFHVTTAYNILRNCGVDVGKRDFLIGG
jgi:hypothetical protein